MSLTPAEEATLDMFTGHPDLTILWSAEQWDLIAEWFSANPEPTLKGIISFLSVLDRAKFFSYINFQDWYSQFNFKLHTGGGVPALGFSVEQIKGVSLQLLTQLLDYGLIEHSIQSLITEMFARKIDLAMYYFLVCLGCDEVLEQKTLFFIGIELGGVPRWQSAGFSRAITAEDCQSAFL